MRRRGPKGTREVRVLPPGGNGGPQIRGGPDTWRPDDHTPGRVSTRSCRPLSLRPSPCSSYFGTVKSFVLLVEVEN